MKTPIIFSVLFLFFIGSVPAENSASQKLDKVGVQLYTLRAEMKEDFAGTLKKVSEMGYRQVEFAGYFGKKPTEVKALLKKYNLEAVATHVPYKDFKKNSEKLCKETAAYGIKYMVVAWVNPLDRVTENQYKKLAKLFNKAGAECKKVGVTFVYHNHDFEFKGDVWNTPFDILLNETDSTLVKFELDLFWIVKAGKDPLGYLNKYAGRFTHFHVKDMDKKKKMVDVGKGTINFSKIFEVGEKQGVQFFIVEHDKPKHPFESIQNSYAHLSKLKY